MSRYTKILTAALLIALASCGGKKDNSSVESESASAADTLPATEVETVDPVLTSRGIQPVSVGMEVADIPDTYPGLYDSITIEEGYGSNTYKFYIQEEPVFIAYEFANATIDVVSAESPRVRVNVADDGSLHLGDNFKKVLSLPGVKAEWESLDGEGVWCWKWEGLWFQPDVASLTDAQSKVFYDSEKVPDINTVYSDTKIGYMGTGLPW